jgi:hypothetical protein
MNRLDIIGLEEDDRGSNRPRSIPVVGRVIVRSETNVRLTRDGVDHARLIVGLVHLKAEHITIERSGPSGISRAKKP